MIRVSGTISLRGHFDVMLDMTEEEFDALSERQQEDEINDFVDWQALLEGSDIIEVDVWELEEVEGEEE